MSDIEQDIQEYASLPDDPELGFATLQKTGFQELQRNLQNVGDVNWYYERQYVDVMLAFDEVHDLGFLVDYRDPPNNDSDFSEYFVRFVRHTELVSQKIKMEVARRTKTGTRIVVVLDTPARDAIHAYIKAIKKKLNELDLSDKKREALFNKLNTFAAEVDRNRTRTESLFALIVEASDVAKTVGDKFKHVQRTVDRIVEKIAEARDVNDALPSWEERKRIERSINQIESPQEDFDDGVPF